MITHETQTHKLTKKQLKAELHLSKFYISLSMLSSKNKKIITSKKKY